MDFSKLTPNQRIIINTVAVAGISMFSILATQPFSWSILWSGFVAGGLTALIQIRKVTEGEPRFLTLI